MGACSPESTGGQRPLGENWAYIQLPPTPMSPPAVATLIAPHSTKLRVTEREAALGVLGQGEAWLEAGAGGSREGAEVPS